MVIEYINRTSENLLLILSLTKIQQLVLWYKNNLSNNIAKTIAIIKYANN